MGYGSYRPVVANELKFGKQICIQLFSSNGSLTKYCQIIIFEDIKSSILEYFFMFKNLKIKKKNSP